VSAVRVALGLRAINAANPRSSGYIELARAAERCGYEAVWAPEVRATDPFTLLGWIASHTTGIGLGCGIAQISARTPIAMATGSVTINGLSGGRFQLGLGVSGPQIVEGWHGRPYRRPLAHMREYLAVVRLALSGQPVSYAGREITLPLAGAADGVAALPLPVPPTALPVHLAGLGRGAVTLAGEVADGWMAIHCPPWYMAAARSWLAEGAAISGRSLDGFATSVMAICCIDDDEELARDLARPTLAVFLGAMGTRQTNFYNRLATQLGFGTAAKAAREAYLAGDVESAIAAIDDEVVGAMAICGNSAQVRERLAAYRDAGVGTVIVTLAAQSLQAQIDQLESIGALAAELSETE
jgi:F420-dependent oxidoreductase-like protein